MSIVKRTYPEASVSVLYDALSDISESEEPLAPGGSEAQDILEPIPVFVLTLDDAANGILPDGANPSSWRFLITDKDISSIADIDTTPNGGAEELSFNRTAEGSNVDRFVQALSVADQLFASKKSDTYEIRLLEVPAINTGTVWLWSPNRSIYIPYLDQERLQGVPPKVDPEFTEKISKLARDRLDTVGNARN